VKDLTSCHIHYTHLGAGPRDVLAVHCTLAHSGAWRGIAREMAQEVTLHAFDMPSHGRSADWAPDAGDYQDLCAAAAHRLLDRPMDLLGHSFGATVALRLAAERPDLVRSLTLIEPVFFAVAKQDDPDAVTAHDADAKPFSDAYESGDFALAARLFNRMWSDGPRWPDLPETTRAAMTRAIHVVPACRSAIYQDRAGLLLPGGLDAITAPARLVRGSKTHPVIGVINDGLARRLPRGESHVVEGAGHMLPITHPAQMTPLLRGCFAMAPI
jgi:pimeloyl-ACP methyl ester carboxylesterase